jgi:hypothetical protein
VLTTDFPHPDSYRAYENELDAREPLRQDFPDHNAYQAAWEQWAAEHGVFQERKTSGAVFIQDNGCGFSTVLVCHRSAPGLPVVRRPGHPGLEYVSALRPSAGEIVQVTAKRAPETARAQQQAPYQRRNRR